MNAFHEHYEQFREGSAAWATEPQYRHMLLDAGLYVGLDARGRILRSPVNGPMSMIAGSAAGKNRDGGIMFNCCSYPNSILAVDLKGENAAVSMSAQLALGKFAYNVNPAGLFGGLLPNHSTDPLDILTNSSPSLVADAKLLAEMLAPLSGSSNAQHWELKARQLYETMMVADAEMNGTASLLNLYRNVSSIEGEPERWFAFAERMVASCYEHVRRFAAELILKQKEAPKEASGYVSEATKHLAFLDDTLLQAGLAKPDFSLKVLCERRCNVYLNIPAEYLSIWGPYLRLLIGVAMSYKSRRFDCPPVVFIVDEAGQLGKAEFLERAMTFGRGQGIIAQAVFQSIGQIERHYGRAGVQTFLGSSVIQQWFGVRDLATAEMLSRVLGKQTLEWNSELDQAAARRNKAHIVRELLAGGDPFEAGLNYAHQARAAVNKTKTARALGTPDEIMRMPPGRQIILAPGIVIAGYSGPYYELLPPGRFHPNPLHPPSDKIRVRGRFGWRTRRVITEDVPRHLRDWPQHQSGKISYIEGYRPF